MTETEIAKMPQTIVRKWLEGLAADTRAALPLGQAYALESVVIAAIEVSGAPERFDGYTIREFAALRGSSHRTVERWVQRGWLRTVRIGRFVRIPAHVSAVKVLPIPGEEVPDVPGGQSTTLHQTIRQVVMERAARTPGIRDQGALADLLTQCMDKAGI